MLLGALIDAGVPLAAVRTALGSLAIDDDAVWTEKVNRAGIMATRFCVRGEALALDTSLLPYIVLKVEDEGRIYTELPRPT